MRKFKLILIWCFGVTTPLVTRLSKVQLLDSGDSSKEHSKEKFSAQFEQPKKKHKKVQSYEDKKRVKLDKSQRKMTSFFQEETNLLLNYESSESSRTNTPSFSPPRSPTRYTASTASPRYSPANSSDSSRRELVSYLDDSD